MSIPLIPESAPFTEPQRAWLNGFLAGWTGLAGAIQGSQLEQPQQEEVQPAEEAEEEFPWHDSSLEMDERLALAEGKPIERRMMAAMAQLNCGACGYVCQSYSEAIAKGEEKNLTLCSPGGKETAKMLKVLVKEGTAPSSNGVAHTNGFAKAQTNGAPVAKASTINRGNPWPAVIKNVHNLNQAGSSKVTTHVVIDLEGSDLTYQVGDSLGVYPTNCPELVDSILAAIACDGREPAEGPDGFSGTVREVLLTKSNLRDVEEELLELLIATTTDGRDKATLQALIDGDRLDELDVLDLLNLAPSAKPRAAALTMTLAALNPRLYSIASSPDAHPGEVHLTVGRAVAEVNGRLRKGVASTMFSDRIQVGDKASVYVHPAHGFTTPSDTAAPMIMVGPGTGIAPFRAFLEDRQVGRATGKNWLFFGEQHAATDFLYESEFAAMQESGLLTKLSTAFSRDQNEKVYVQTRMLEAGRELYEWLEAGAYFFVCGDARRMAKDVDSALREIIAVHGGKSAAQAKEYVERLQAENRYQRDVY